MASVDIGCHSLAWPPPTPSLISWAWLSCLPNSPWLRARLQSGGSRPLLLLSPAGKQQSRSRPRQGLVTRPLPPPGARGTWRGKGRELSLPPPLLPVLGAPHSATFGTFVSGGLSFLSLRNKEEEK